MQHCSSAGDAGRVTVIAPLVVFTKYPTPATAVKKHVLTVVSQEAAPVAPKPAAVPLFVIVAPLGIVIVSPLSPNWTVPQFVLGLNFIYFYFTHNLPIEICTLLLLYLNRLLLLFQELRSSRTTAATASVSLHLQLRQCQLASSPPEPPPPAPPEASSSWPSYWITTCSSSATTSKISCTTNRTWSSIRTCKSWRNKCTMLHQDRQDHWTGTPRTASHLLLLHHHLLQLDKNHHLKHHYHQVVLEAGLTGGVLPCAPCSRVATSTTSTRTTTSS